MKPLVTWMVGAFLLGSFALGVPGAPRAFGYDSRMSIDPAQDLGALASSGEIKVTISHDGQKVKVDASSVFKVDLEKLHAATIDFDHYTAFGVPDLKEMHVVEQGPGDLLYQWQDLVASGYESKQYCEVRLSPALTNAKARAAEWQMVPRRSNWPYEEKSQFSSVDGSWYLEPLPDGTVYSRYFQSVTVNLALPGWLIELLIKGTVTNDTKKLIQAVAAAAR